MISIGRLLREELLGLGINEIQTATLPRGPYFGEVLSGELSALSGKVLKTG